MITVTHGQLMRVDSLTFFVLNAMADDWESILQIEPQVHEYHGVVERKLILQALRRLHDVGHVLAMDQDGFGLSEFPGSPEAAWYRMTDSGRALFEANIPCFDK